MIENLPEAEVHSTIHYIIFCKCKTETEHINSGTGHAAAAAVNVNSEDQLKHEIDITTYTARIINYFHRCFNFKHLATATDTDVELERVDLSEYEYNCRSTQQYS